MFHKFHVATQEAPARFVAPAESGLIDWSMGCIGCLVCVKKVCPHQAYEQRGVDPVSLQDKLDFICADCFRCVQSCPQRLIHKSLNPEYASLGNRYWTPEIISATWAQAATGKIPVSGAGYGGPFSGPGFDSMWTDMSEIVRPTRDGIHGREYISTAIQLGRREPHLSFDPEGGLTSAIPDYHEIPIPILFSLPPGIEFGQNVQAAVDQAAERLTTLRSDLPVGEESAGPLVWLVDPDNLRAAQSAFKDKIIAVHLDLGEKAAEEVVGLVRAGAGVIHLRAGFDGREANGRFIKDAVREIHLALVEETLRDQVTLLGSGGIAMAEHVAKAIICGLDGVIIDWPLLLALECRFCADCRPDQCPVHINRVEPEWGAQRIINLIGAWRDQLLEVLGAMGLREVRRLRGEVGRAMFKDELEAEIFAPIFEPNQGRGVTP